MQSSTVKVKETETVCKDIAVDPRPLSPSRSFRGNPDVIRGKLKLFQELLNSRLDLGVFDLRQGVTRCQFAPANGTGKGLQHVMYVSCGFEAVSCSSQVVASLK